jgi:hypothetical protein
MQISSRSSGVIKTKLFTYDVVADPGLFIHDPIKEMNKKRIEKIKRIKQNIIPQ